MEESSAGESRPDPVEDKVGNGASHANLTADTRGEDDLQALTSIFPNQQEGILRAALDLTPEGDHSKRLSNAVEFLNKQTEQMETSEKIRDTPQKRRLASEDPQIRDRKKKFTGPEENNGEQADAVAGSIGNGLATKSTAESSSNGEWQIQKLDIFEVVQEIMKEYPRADPNWIYEELEGPETLEDNRAATLNKLQTKFSEGPSQQPEENIAGPSEIKSSSSSAMTECLSSKEMEIFKEVTHIFPLVDPIYVVKRIAEFGETLETMVDRMSGDSSYPKWKDRIERERRERRRDELLDPIRFNIEEFLKVFPNPEEHFSDEAREVSENYKAHCRTHLGNTFTNVATDVIDQVLREYRYHLLAAYRTLLGRNRGIKLQRHRSSRQREDLQWPDDIDEGFFWELQYIMNEREIQDRITAQKDRRQAQLEECRRNNNLKECDCCFSDEILEEDLVKCSKNPDPHHFCAQCVKEHCKVQLGEGHHQIKCIHTECKGTYEVGVLKNIVDGRSLGTLLKRSQENELRSANMENMEGCPFCDFAMIIENPDELLFRCQNQKCLRESCRKCKELNHIPLKCSEVEKASDTRMRTYIEDKMAEAMIRKCPKCGKRIIKSDGCNSMKCPCGAYMCYVCGETLDHSDPYSHFDRGGFLTRLSGGDNTNSPSRKRCPVQTEMDRVHADVAAKAGEDAKKEYAELHPNLKDATESVQLDKLIDRESGQRGRRRFGLRLEPIRDDEWMWGNQARLDIHLGREEDRRHMMYHPVTANDFDVMRRHAETPQAEREARARREVMINRLRRLSHREPPAALGVERPVRPPSPPPPQRQHLEEEFTNTMKQLKNFRPQQNKRLPAPPAGPAEKKFDGPAQLRKMRENMQVLIRLRREDPPPGNESRLEINRMYLEMKALTERLSANDGTARAAAAELLDRMKAQIRMEQYRVNARELSVVESTGKPPQAKGKKIKPVEDPSDDPPEPEPEAIQTVPQNEPVGLHQMFEALMGIKRGEIVNPVPVVDTMEIEELFPPQVESIAGEMGETGAVVEPRIVEEQAEDHESEAVAEPSLQLLKARRNSIQKELGNAQRKVARCRDPKIQREEFRNVQALMRKRDKVVRQIQAQEASALREGASEDTIRPELSSLQLDRDEIEGAAEEAGVLAREAKRAREKETEALMTSKKELRRLDKAYKHMYHHQEETGGSRSTNTILRGPGHGPDSGQRMEMVVRLRRERYDRERLERKNREQENLRRIQMEEADRKWRQSIDQQRLEADIRHPLPRLQTPYLNIHPDAASLAAGIYRPTRVDDTPGMFRAPQHKYLDKNVTKRPNVHYDNLLSLIPQDEIDRLVREEPEAQNMNEFTPENLRASHENIIQDNGSNTPNDTDTWEPIFQFHWKDRSTNERNRPTESANDDRPKGGKKRPKKLLDRDNPQDGKQVFPESRTVIRADRAPSRSVDKEQPSTSNAVSEWQRADSRTSGARAEQAKSSQNSTENSVRSLKKIEHESSCVLTIDEKSGKSDDTLTRDVIPTELICPTVSDEALTAINPITTVEFFSNHGSLTASGPDNAAENGENSKSSYKTIKKVPSSHNLPLSGPSPARNEDAIAGGSGAQAQPRTPFERLPRLQLNAKEKGNVELKAALETERMLRARVETMQRSMQVDRARQMMQDLEGSEERTRALERQRNELRQAIATVTQAIGHATNESAQIQHRINLTMRTRREEENILRQARDDLQVVSDRIAYLKREDSLRPAATATNDAEQAGPSTSRASAHLEIPEDILKKIREACASGNEERLREMLDNTTKEAKKQQKSSKDDKSSHPCLISLVSDDEDEVSVETPQSNSNESFNNSTARTRPAESTAEIYLESNNPQEPWNVVAAEETVDNGDESAVVEVRKPDNLPRNPSLVIRAANDNVSNQDSMEISPPQLQRSFSVPSNSLPTTSWMSGTSTANVDFHWSKYYHSLGAQRSGTSAVYGRSSDNIAMSAQMENLVPGPNQPQAPGPLHAQAHGDAQRGVIQINIHLPEGGGARAERTHAPINSRGLPPPDGPNPAIQGSGQEPHQEEHMDFEEAV